MGSILRSIVLLHKISGNTKEGAEYLAWSIHVGRIVLGDHYIVADALCNLGSILQTKYRLSDALQCYHDALKIKKSIFGDVHEEIVEVLYCIGILHDSSKNYEKSKETYQEIVDVTKALSEDKDSFLSTMLALLGKLYLIEGNVDNAVEALSQAMYMVATSEYYDEESSVIDLLQSIFCNGINFPAAAA